MNIKEMNIDDFKKEVELFLNNKTIYRRKNESIRVRP